MSDRPSPRISLPSNGAIKQSYSSGAIYATPRVPLVEQKPYVGLRVYLLGKVL